jgi:hypothetical protein
VLLVSCSAPLFFTIRYFFKVNILIISSLDSVLESAYEEEEELTWGEDEEQEGGKDDTSTSSKSSTHIEEEVSSSNQQQRSAPPIASTTLSKEITREEILIKEQKCEADKDKEKGEKGIEEGKEVALLIAEVSSLRTRVIEGNEREKQLREQVAVLEDQLSVLTAAKVVAAVAESGTESGGGGGSEVENKGSQASLLLTPPPPCATATASTSTSNTITSTTGTSTHDTHMEPSPLSNGSSIVDVAAPLVASVSDLSLSLHSLPSTCPSSPTPSLSGESSPTYTDTDTAQRGSSGGDEGQLQPATTGGRVVVDNDKDEANDEEEWDNEAWE